MSEEWNRPAWVKQGVERLEKLLREILEFPADARVTVYDGYDERNGYIISEVDVTRESETGMAGVAWMYADWEAFPVVAAMEYIVTTADIKPVLNHQDGTVEYDEHGEAVERLRWLLNAQFIVSDEESRE